MHAREWRSIGLCELLEGALDGLVSDTSRGVGQRRLAKAKKAVKQRRLLADQERPLTQLGVAVITSAMC